MKSKLTEFDNYKQNVTIDRLRKDEGKIKTKSNSLGRISYPEFLKYFADLKTITKHNVIIGINFTYGWMPTMFAFRSGNLDEAVKILNRAKQGKIPSESELGILRNCFNNSLVGTSKLLHFINPEKFAIWDSRVYRYLTGAKPYNYRIDKCKSYLDFLRFCEEVTIKAGYNKIHNSLIKKIGYKMTKYRTIELVMYLSK